MRQGANTTYVRYTLLRASGSLSIELSALVNYRDFHSTTHAGDWRMRIEAAPNGVQVIAFDGATPFYLLSREAKCSVRHEWHRNCLLPMELYRGLDDREDHLLAAAFSAELNIGESVTLVFTSEADADLVDAALWCFEAVREYFSATRDEITVTKLFPVLAQMIDWHLTGTRYQIHVDAADGLLYAGEPGLQLTWMDAKVGEDVVTPRIGKPVEVNALWYNALETMASLAPMVGASSAPFTKLAATVKKSFARFWNEEGGYCYDVIDAPGVGNDTSLRPNQIFSVSLPKSPLSPAQQKSVVDACARRLVTSHGLRSLAQGETDYAPHYGGSPWERDSAYHQGTVWGWLMGPFVQAHLRVYGDARSALSFLEPLGKQIASHGLGTLSEIFDAEVPFSPRGCIAQAWTVAEVLRAWHAVAGYPVTRC